MLERVVQLRRGKAAEAEAETPADEGVKTEAGYAEQIKALEERIAHLEAIVEGLQDAFHREAVRRGKQIDGVRQQLPLAIPGVGDGVCLYVGIGKLIHLRSVR